MAETAAIILAAGKSTRMNSALPKVLHEVCGQPMLSYVIGACRGAGVDRIVVVVGYGKEQVLAAYDEGDALTWVTQSDQRGTGHAALMCEDALAGFSGAVLVIAGDMPLIRSETVEKLLSEHARTGDGVTLATSIFDDPTGYGRIVRDDAGRLSDIVEHADCTDAQREIKEVNISYYCFNAGRMFETLHRITPDNAKGEYYITDAVRILLEDGHGARAIAAVDPSDAMGINSRADLARVNSIMQRRIQDEWMMQGVTIVDTSSTWIENRCEIGKDTTIHPFSFLGAGSRIGAGCRVGPFASVRGDEPIAAGSTFSPAPTVGIEPS